MKIRTLSFYIFRTFQDNSDENQFSLIIITNNIL